MPSWHECSVAGAAVRHVFEGRPRLNADRARWAPAGRALEFRYISTRRSAPSIFSSTEFCPQIAQITADGRRRWGRFDGPSSAQICAICGKLSPSVSSVENLRHSSFGLRHSSFPAHRILQPVPDLLPVIFNRITTYDDATRHLQKNKALFASQARHLRKNTRKTHEPSTSNPRYRDSARFPVAGSPVPSLRDLHFTTGRFRQTGRFRLS